MLEGLLLAWDKGFRKIEVESDNALLVELFQSGGRSNSSVAEMRLIHQILQRDWEIRLRHISRNANETTDAMAKLIRVGDSMLHIFTEPPVTVTRFLQKEKCDASMLYL